MNFSVTKNGKDFTKYNWNEKSKIFSADADNLVLDFSDISGITFKTGSACTFKTGSNCTFKTSSDCTFDTGFNCTFNTDEKCVVIRRDVFEVIQLEAGKNIKLNCYKKKGFTYIEDKKIITIAGKDIELSQDSFDNLKKQLLDK